MRRIALLGGAYNPITKGHLQIADVIINNSDMEEVWLVPCYDHLQKNISASPEDRLAMCNIAIRTIPYVQVCRYEIDKKMDGSALTCVSELKKIWGDSIEFHYVIGMDNVLKFNTWKKPEELKSLVNFIVLPRAGIEKSPDLWYQQDPHKFIDINIMNVSSTQVREMLKKWWEDPKSVEKELLGLIDKGVLDYIRLNELYK